MLIEPKHTDALECLKYRHHCDVVGTISHNMKDGLYLVVTVIRTPLCKQIWTAECGTLCSVSLKVGWPGIGCPCFFVYSGNMMVLEYWRTTTIRCGYEPFILLPT